MKLFFELFTNNFFEITIVTVFLKQTLHLSLKAATEENMQQRRLIKDLGESLGPYRFGEFKF